MAKAIMIQGTASNTGKSLLAAGLCRLLSRDGLRVAPFKSQNMALNSYITREGFEMGRAQVMQAEAAGIEPDVRMNPILLKPESDTGSQVVVNGEVRGSMPAGEYFRQKHTLIPDIMRAYNSLAEENDLLVLEGAGSPAEINLKADDIVNMGMAALAHAPVIIVGDIDRGGVFAALYGTVALLEPEERRRVKGFVINKFRGAVALLRPGLAQLEALTGIPVLGVVPMLPLALDDEDSLADCLTQANATKALDVAVLRPPHISNFTDFAPLERHADMGVRYVTCAKDLRRPDLLILPGTKNTMGDLLWLRENGFEAPIKALAATGTPILGVCGGYQMLGETLSDPDGAEQGGELQGLGLLPVNTVFSRQKERARVSARLCPGGVFAPLCGCEAEGYELHMGRTALEEGTTPFCAVMGDGGERPDGAVRGNVAGTYLHGIFESGALTEGLAAMLCARAGITPTAAPPMDYHAFKEEQYDRLADALREALDMEKIYKIIEEGAE